MTRIFSEISDKAGRDYLLAYCAGGSFAQDKSCPKDVEAGRANPSPPASSILLAAAPCLT